MNISIAQSSLRILLEGMKNKQIPKFVGQFLTKEDFDTASSLLAAALLCDDNCTLKSFTENLNSMRSHILLLSFIYMNYQISICADLSHMKRWQFNFKPTFLPTVHNDLKGFFVSYFPNINSSGVKLVESAYVKNRPFIKESSMNPKIHPGIKNISRVDTKLS